MSKKKRPDPSDQKELLENLIKKQGFILEHQTHKVLLDYFKNQDSKNEYAAKLNTDGISHRIKTDKRKEGYIEIDTYCEFSQHVYGIQYCTETPAGMEDERSLYGGLKIKTYLIIQCKGHPSDGLLLCRYEANSSDDYPECIYITDNLLFASNRCIKRGNVNIINWASFISIKEGGKEYKQDEKFYDAVKQLNDSLIALHEDQFLYSPPRGTINLKCNVIRIIPVIVTNCPILLMKIDVENNVCVCKEIPHVIYFNSINLLNLEWDLKQAIRAHKYYHVINFDYLKDFMEIIIDLRKDFSSLSGKEVAYHKFII